MSAPSIPTSYTHHLHPDKTFDVDLEGGLDTRMSGAFGAQHSGSINTIMSGNLATDNKVEILNLPRFTLQDIKDMQKVRVHIPNYSNICFKVFGMELFSICMNGEAQVITEPYIPNAAERCEDNCCEPDTRPFPERGNPNGTDPVIIPNS
ncbi:MAG TPA: hypothetical protein PK191_08485 [Niabella sp.]|nr:hypothetical protein [Niabella sp.]HOZ95631.1 hypothetical protein [Niabella sp.]HQW13871.1 hypothetical protein [Niabella sp.]HQX19236.1 hypothetical protein [Niabella sp.]HQX41045.1 hypothetical protein [Niabella sp.]